MHNYHHRAVVPHTGVVQTSVQKGRRTRGSKGTCRK